MKFSNIEFINKAEKVYQNENSETMFDYSKTKYKNINSHVIIICKKCGNEFTQRAAHHLRICKKCGNQFSQRASHHMNGSGCINCNKSNGEKYIEK
jgi:uncharacterized CHY-type Zn-finger protein